MARVLLASLVLFVLTPSMSCGDDAAVFERVAAANAFARESIRSIRLDFEAMKPAMGKQSQSIIRGTYLRQGDRWRLEHDDPNATGSKALHVMDGQTVRSLVHSPWSNGTVRRTGNIRNGGTKASAIDPWVTAMMSIDEIIPNTSLPLDAVTGRGVEYSRVEMDGDFVFIRYTPSRGVVEVAADRRYNYRVTSVSSWSASKSRDARGELRANRMKMILPGIYFPEEVDYTIFESGKPQLYRRTQFNNIRVNIDIPGERFDLKFPHGILVANRLTNQVYSSDEFGTPIGPPITTQKSDAIPTSSPASLPHRETTEEPASSSRWLALAGITLILAAVILAARRRSAGRTGSERLGP